jgi:uncharacterized membrane protein YcaP (DUF421 family)
MKLFPESWTSIFGFDVALIEIVARGSVLYFAILILLRLMPRRMGGELATMDLIFIVLIAQGAAHSMGGYTSVADGFVLIATLIGWNYLINALSYRLTFIEWLVSSPPLPVVRNGKFLRRNMRKEFLTEEELMGHLREHGIDDVSQVKAAYVESEGKITAIRNKDCDAPKSP